MDKEVSDVLDEFCKESAKQLQDRQMDAEAMKKLEMARYLLDKQKFEVSVRQQCVSFIVNSGGSIDEAIIAKAKKLADFILGKA